jgi:hypothetical protein
MPALAPLTNLTTLSLDKAFADPDWSITTWSDRVQCLRCAALRLAGLLLLLLPLPHAAATAFLVPQLWAHSVPRCERKSVSQ